jgi:hypothetical protein
MDGLEKSMPFTEGLIEAENAGKGPHNSNCLNCETVLTGVFCSTCGQKDLPKRQSIKELLENFISSFWSYESKFFKTGRYILFKPGFLATEYCEGRRERYYHPARMYVFISFVYFLLFTSLPDTDTNDINFAPPNANDKKEVMEFNLFGTKYKTLASYDSAQQVQPLEKKDNWLERRIVTRQIELQEKYKGNGKQFANDFKQAFLGNFSTVFFWLLPVFALVLKLLYVRRDYFYSEHLVFSIYYYNLFYLAGSFYMLSASVSWLDWLATIIGFWIALYMLFAMKRMYKQSWRKTIVKYLAFGTIFSLCILLGLAIDMFIILMSI